MAFLNELQVENIKSHMTSDEGVLSIKMKAKNTPYITRSISIGELDDYIDAGWEKTGETKRKARIRIEKKHDVKFEDDIWCMFYKLGIKTLNTDENLRVQWGPNESDTQQLDVVAVGEDAIFVVECKSAETPKNKSFKETLNLMEQYKEGVSKALKQIYGQEKRVKFILATRNYRFAEDGEDQKRMKDKKIFHLNDNAYNYITNLIKSYKDAVKYQFYGLLFKDEIISNDRYVIPALRGTMGGRIYYLFSIEPSTLLKIGFVLHRTRVNDSLAPTYQRLLVPSRLKGITKFIDDGGFFPNSIIVNFAGTGKKLGIRFDAIDKSQDTKAKLGMLHIPNAYGIAYIIDGQHRVYGYAGSKHKEDNTIPVVAFENMESEDQLKIFMDINENQKAVSPSLRLDLNEDINWNSGQLDSRMKALRSSIIKALASSSNNVLYNKISIGEDNAELAFKPFDTALSKSELIPKATKTQWSGDCEVCIYNTNETDSEKAMVDSRKRITQFINGAYLIADGMLGNEQKEQYLFSNRGTYAFITLLGSLHRFLIKTEKISSKSPIPDRIEAIRPYIEYLSNCLNNLSDEESSVLKGSLGQGADTFWFRSFQSYINKGFEQYEPEDLKIWKETQDDSLQRQGQDLKKEIQDNMRSILFALLENIYGEKWENNVSIIKNECERRILKEIEDNEDDSIDNYDWKDYLEISDFKSIIEKNFSNEVISNSFSIDLGEGIKTRKEKLAWLSLIEQPKGKKNSALTRDEVNKLWLVLDHLKNVEI